MSLLTCQDYLVHYYEIDAKKRALISTIINYLMDVCSLQSENAGVGVDYMLSENRGWILTQWDIKINRYPLYNETVTACTNAHSFYKYFAYRKNFIKDKDNNLIVDAQSTWLLVDTNKRRPVKISDDMYKAYEISEDQTERFKNAALKHLDTWTTEKTFNVRYSDIDTNKHVNNVKYISWIIESVPLDLALNCEMKELTIVYKKETGYGHTIDVHTAVEKSETGYICKHNIINNDGEDLTLATTIWE